MTAWSPDLARKTYSIPHWSDGYFDVDDRGRIVVRPKGAKDAWARVTKEIDLFRGIIDQAGIKKL